MLIWKDRNVKNPEDPTDEWLVRDLLCDLKHFCDEYAIDFDSELSEDPTDEWLVRDLLCDLKHFCDEYALILIANYLEQITYI
jgi:hypothetical protein